MAWAAVGLPLTAYRMVLGEALRNTENLSKDLTPLSSVAYGDTSFLWKEAPALRHAALETQAQIP